jgi:hypothetical protein
MAAIPPYEFLEYSYFPFRLYAEFRQGETLEALSSKYAVNARWLEERIEAVRLCVDKQIWIYSNATKSNG